MIDYKKYSKTVCIDFDGTIVRWAWPSVGDLHIGVKEVMDELKNMGYKIVVSSCRTNKKVNDNPKKHLKIMKKIIKENNLPVDEIDDGNQGKVIASIYVDDRGINFNENNGGWEKVLKEIKRRSKND